MIRILKAPNSDFVGREAAELCLFDLEALGEGPVTFLTEYGDIYSTKCYPPKGDRKIGGFFMCFCSVFILFSIYM